jgi:hypothetical protein
MVDYGIGHGTDEINFLPLPLNGDGNLAHNTFSRYYSQFLILKYVKIRQLTKLLDI